MKVKTSVTLSEDVLEAVDAYAEPQGASRSAVIEAAVRAFLRRQAHEAQAARDMDILDRAADRLNAEALDVLDFQVMS